MPMSIKISCLREDIPNAFIQCVVKQTYLLTYLLTPCSRVLLMKLTG